MKLHKYKTIKEWENAREDEVERYFAENRQQEFPSDEMFLRQDVEWQFEQKNPRPTK